VGQDTHQHFVVLAFIFACRQGRPEMPFEAREHRFGMSTATIPALGEATMQLGTIPPLRLLHRKAARVEFDRREPNAKLFPRKDVIMLAVVSGISKETIEIEVRCRLPHSGRKIRRIMAGTAPERDTSDQVRVGMGNSRQFGPSRMGRKLVALRSSCVMAADMTGLKAGRVNGTFGFGVDQAALACAVEDGRKESVEAPFFKSFCAT
jgi:hypothetical protein